MSTKISFITFTRNSGRRLKLLLENVKDVVDEIIVIDGYSTDDTVEIAKSYGAKVFLRKPWGHVEPDRMFALRKASYDWILYLDDDELLGLRLRNELRGLIEKADKEEFVALSTVRVYYDTNCKSLVFGRLYPNRQVRIYRKDRVQYRGLVHELPKVFGSIFELPEEYYIAHYGPCGGLSVHKMVFYAYLESIEYYAHFEHPRIKRSLWRFSPLSAPYIVLYRLLKDVVIKKNPYLNLCTVLRTIYPYSFYEVLVSTLMQFRGKRRTQISKFVQRYGLIKLLERELS